MYKERMNDYLPEVIRKIKEFQAVIDAEYPEIDELNVAYKSVLDNAYLSTMDESVLVEWEKILGLKPTEDATVENRRDSVIAAIRGQGKMNTSLIEAIVSSFTGGIAESWIIDSVLYVKIYPPENNKTYIFDSVEQALALKIPAHLNTKVYANYSTWDDIKSYASTWSEVDDKFQTWEKVKFFISSSNNDIYEYIVDESGNSIKNERNNKLFN